MKYKNENGYSIINFGKQVNFASIQIQKEIFKKSLEAKNEILLKADKIVQIDTASLQLLLSFLLAANASQLSWQWVKPSYTIIKAAEFLGLRNLLKLPEYPGDLHAG